MSFLVFLPFDFLRFCTFFFKCMNRHDRWILRAANFEQTHFQFHSTLIVVKPIRYSEIHLIRVRLPSSGSSVPFEEGRETKLRKKRGEAMDMENSRARKGCPSATRDDNFDVYLSFRESDTRWSFANPLYRSLVHAGIRVFRDDEFVSGKSINRSIYGGIRHSKIAIVILSEKYSSSVWCLQELAQILRCHRMTGQIVMPVFLNVTPGVVRHTSHGCNEVVAEHRRRGLDPDTLREWEEALVHVASIPGLESNR